MNSLPEITQDNIRLLLPAKIARAAAAISETSSLPPLDALMLFYGSKTYRLLENEPTKYWWLSPYQLANAFFHENDPVNS